MVFLPSKSRVPFLISLFNFQGPIAILFRRQLNEYITYPRSCQYFFESFFKKLFDSFLLASGFPAESLYIISPLSPFVNTFPQVFLFFFNFVYTQPCVFVVFRGFNAIYWVALSFRHLLSIY